MNEINKKFDSYNKYNNNIDSNNSNSNNNIKNNFNDFNIYDDYNVDIKNKKLEKIRKDIILNLDCNLKKNQNLVFGKGNPNAKVFFIGEAPGKKENELGIPFVGKAGKDLNKELNKIGLNLDDVYIANILKYRPPNNRNPTKIEIEKHTPYLVKQIKIIKPKIIIPLGNFATKFVLSNFQIKNMNKIEGISKLHGKIFDLFINYNDDDNNINKSNVKIIPFFHPSAMIYNNKLRKDFENDFLILKTVLE